MEDQIKKEDKEIKLEQYIDQKLKAGYNIQEIKKVLLDSGWAQEKVNNAIDAIKGPETEPVQKKPRHINRRIIEISIIFVIIIVIVAFVGNFLANKREMNCNKMSDEFFRAQCYVDIAIEKNDLSVCDNKFLDDIHKAICHSEYSARTNDSSNCNTLKDTVSLSICYLELARSDGIPVCDNLSRYSFYNKVKVPTTIKDCYLFFGRIPTNLSRCSDLPEEEQEACYADFSELISDISVCNELLSKMDVSLCEVNYLLQKKEISACEDLENQEQKEACETYQSILMKS